MRVKWRAILRYERMPLSRLAGDRGYKESEGVQDEEEEGEAVDEE